MKSNSLQHLQQLLTELRDAQTGCAWTREQTWQSLAPQTLDECQELIEAIESEQPDAICNELGDMLYHILFYCQLAAEQNLFTFDDIIRVVLSKHQQRMPSPEQRQHMTAEQINAYWQQRKQEEKRQ